MADRFSSSKLIVENSEGIQYLRNVIYPMLPPSDEDTYVISTGGDRYDKLSLQFYKTVDYWWVIASANTDSMDSLVITPGVQLRIPHNPVEWQEAFEKLNDC